MSGWTEKINAFTQGAVNKSRELAEIAKLNLEIGNEEAVIRQAKADIGDYVAAAGLLSENETVAAELAKISAAQQIIQQHRERIAQLRDLVICPACGAEVDRGSRFCNYCGTPLPQPAEEPAEEPAQEPAEEDTIIEITVEGGEPGPQEKPIAPSQEQP